MAAASAPITSPLTATGTAGGQLTVGTARIRPTDRAAGTVSRGENAASRGVQATAGGRRRRLSRRSGVVFGLAPRLRSIRARSSARFAGVIISTTASGSAYSHSTPPARSRCASSAPSQPEADAANVSFKGSLGSTCQPASARRCFSASTPAAQARNARG